jgi:hypothetical protein
MTEQPEEETQHTPKGAEIPSPDRSEVFRDLEKVAKPRKPSSPANGKGGSQS